MTGPTHVFFGLLVAEFACSSFGYEMDGRSLVVAGIGSLLPDIDHPNSTIGFLLRPTLIPQTIEQRLGHRTITHSWIFMLLLLVVLYPLWYFWGLLYYLAAWIAAGSHILIDMSNIQGVPLFWPNRLRWVFPPAERYRITVGSRGEIIFAAILLVATTAFTPISFMGMRSAFYLLTRDVFSASREARQHFPEYELTCQVRGTWRDSLMPSTDTETFRVVAMDQDQLFFARGDAVFSGPSMTIDHILVERAYPTQRSSKSVPLNYQLIDEVSEQIPDGAIITGVLTSLKLSDDQMDASYITQSEEFHTVSFAPIGKDNEIITIAYCPAERFRKALVGRGIFILTGVLTVTSSSAATEHRLHEDASHAGSDKGESQ